jgi:hypothetical protein
MSLLGESESQDQAERLVDHWELRTRSLITSEVRSATCGRPQEPAMDPHGTSGEGGQRAAWLAALRGRLANELGLLEETGDRWLGVWAMSRRAQAIGADVERYYDVAFEWIREEVEFGHRP